MIELYLESMNLISAIKTTLSKINEEKENIILQ